MIRKYSDFLIVLILFAMSMSACATATIQAPVATAEPTPPPVTITIWHLWSGAYLTVIQAVFTQYMTEHPNVTIVLDTPANLLSDLQIAIPAKEGPDIISWANDAIGKYAANEYIIDLGTLGITQNFLKTTYEPAAVNGVIWHDKIWALPESQEAIALVYNKTMVSAGAFPSDPLDFAGLLVMAKSYTEDNPGKYLVCDQGLGAADAYNAAPVYFGFGVPGYVDDNGNVYVNTPQAIAAGNWIKNFSAYSPKEASYDICDAGFTDGTFAAWWTGPESITNIEKAGIDYGILPMGKPFVGIKALMITKNAVDRGTAETALDIIKYFTNQANEIQLTLANKTIPANTAALNDPQIHALQVIRGFGASAHIGIPIPNTPYADAQWVPVGDATQTIWNGSQTPEQALTTAQTTIVTAMAGMK